MNKRECNALWHLCVALAELCSAHPERVAKHDHGQRRTVRGGTCLRRSFGFRGVQRRAAFRSWCQRHRCSLEASATNTER
jgi:hypothetical protein